MIYTSTRHSFSSSPFFDSDYGHYIPVLRAIQRDPELKLHLIAAAAHLSPEFGHTIDVILQDGFPVADRVEMLLSGDSPSAIAKSMGLSYANHSLHNYLRLLNRPRPLRRLHLVDVDEQD